MPRRSYSLHPQSSADKKTAAQKAAATGSEDTIFRIIFRKIRIQTFQGLEKQRWPPLPRTTE
jgi:hypothetical protein